MRMNRKHRCMKPQTCLQSFGFLQEEPRGDTEGRGKQIFLKVVSEMAGGSWK